MAESVISREAGSLTQEYMASYSRYVAQSRSVPSLVDGLKPVQRRVLNSANDLHLYHDKRYLKTAKLEGQVLGDYHPHGGASVSGLVQPFKIRYPLLEGQGNWGCPDDPGSVAASRYTEVRLTKFAEDFYLESADYADREDNYDGRLKEIVQYYPPIPGVLLTGAEGIAIGLTTKIPVHEVGVAGRSLLSYINEPNSTEYLDIMVPDTCEGSILLSSQDDVRKLYTTGEATLNYRAKTHYEYGDTYCHLVVDSFPPGFSRKKLQTPKILEYVEQGILSLSNESSTGIRYVFTVAKKDVEILDIIQDSLTSSVSYKMHIESHGQVALYDLKRLYDQFLEDRKVYISRKYKDLFNKANEETSYISALLKVKSDREHIHKILELSEDEAIKYLMSINEGTTSGTESIARRILSTSLIQLTSDNTNKLINKLEDLQKLKEEYVDYISDPMIRIVRDIEELVINYGGKMNSDISYLNEVSQDVVGFVVENGSIVLGKNPDAKYESKYYFIHDHEGFVVVEGDYFRSKGYPVLLSTDDLQAIYGFDDFSTTKVLYDDVEVQLDTWSLRKRTSKIICKESKSKKLLGISKQTSL